MSYFSLVMVAVAVSLDGFWGGFAFGLRKIKITFLSLLVISSWSVFCSLGTMLVGSYLKNYISIEAGQYIGAVLLLLLGIFTLREGYKQEKENPGRKANIDKLDFKLNNLFRVLNNPLLADVDKENDIKPAEGILLGLAVAMDASVAAFTLSLLGHSPYFTPLLFGLTHFVLIGMGSIIGRHNLINRVAQKFALLPGFILILMALLRMI